MKQNIKLVLKKIKNKYYRFKLKYLKYYRKLKIDDSFIMIEAQHGAGIMGNMYYVLKEIRTNPKYQNYKVAVVVRGSKIPEVRRFLQNKNIENYEMVTLASKRFYEVLASAKYLITDTSMTPNYIKKDGQVLINTWHGTPLKYLGKKVRSEPHTIGNVQRNFIQSDYLLYPNEYMKNHMIEDYMLENVCKAKVLLSGYPRNTVFFDDDVRNEIRDKYELNDKQVIAYMPTWRGVVGKVEEKISNTYVNYFLLEIDKKLNENQILYVNLHPFVGSSINYRMFKNIKPFPKEYETYEFLSASDCLITDYSSVFIDYVLSNKKIILFTYDEEEYLKDRGMYLNIKDLPFPSVKTIDELLDEINSPINYKYDKFVKDFCPFDSKDATSLFCEKTILGIDNEIKEEEIPNNGKDNVLIYAGNLAKNGITTSIRNLLNSLDLDKHNYYITFLTKAVAPYKDILFEIPDKVKYIPMPNGLNGSFKDKVITLLYYLGIIKAKTFMKHESNVYRLELKRLYGDINFSSVIQFSGYEKRNIVLFSLFDCNTIIYVHSNMQKEIETRKTQRKDILKYAYTHYNKIAVVTDGLIESTMKFNAPRENIYVSNNIINYEDVQSKSKMDIIFDSNTNISIETEKFMDILNDKKLKKFITIGRFSKEKGHMRLVNAFNKFYCEDKNNNNYLIIIGGHGNEYNHLLEHIKSLECSNNVILVKSVSNPYSILKRCDYFIFSSFYEGFGLVVVEADIVGMPVVSTNIDGIRKFMTDNKGTMVDNSEEGLYEGFKLLASNKVKKMKVDYDKYNKNAIKEFEQLLENE